MKEKFTERRHRKQLSLEERRQREIRKRCKTCKDLKDCEVHRSHINATQSTSSDSNRSPGPEQSAPQQEVIRASPSREENNSGDGENSAKRIVQGKGHDDAVFVPDLKEPTCFEDLQENFNKVRSHFYRMGSLNDRTWSMYQATLFLYSFVCFYFFSSSFLSSDFSYQLNEQNI